MRTFGRAILQRLREILYLLLSFPVSTILFALVMLGLNFTTFIPVAILIFLLMLTAMEHISRFEIRRTNFLLGTDFRVIDNWFSYPFLSWEGAKERITSLRVWLAVGYVFIAFGWSLFSFILVIFGLSGLFLMLISVGILTLANFSRSFEVIDNGELFEGSISYDNSTGRVRLEFGDSIDSGINWDLFSNWILLVAVIFFALALWVIPRNARAMAQLAEGLLSGSYLPAAQAQIAKWRKRQKVSEREVRVAMDSEALQPQLSELSKREREILSLMAQGRSNAGIAKTLYITEGSVEKHVSNILHKLGLNAGEDNHRRVLAVLRYLGIESANNGKDERVGQ